MHAGGSGPRAPWSGQVERAASAGLQLHLQKARSIQSGPCARPPGADVTRVMMLRHHLKSRDACGRFKKSSRGAGGEGGSKLKKNFVKPGTFFDFRFSTDEQKILGDEEEFQRRRIRERRWYRVSALFDSLKRSGKAWGNVASSLIDEKDKGDSVKEAAIRANVTAFWTTDHISEIAWSTRRGYEGLLDMLGGLAINKTALSWFEPSDGPFYTDYMDQGVSVTVERPTMFRVNDVPAALRSLKPDPELKGEFTLSIGDLIVPENVGPWRVTYSDGKVEVEKLSSRPSVDLQMQVRHFAQAFLGEPSIGQLVSVGNVEVQSTEGLLAASRLLPAQSVCCMDFF